MAAVLACEIARGSPTLGTSATWPLVEAAAVALALVLAWRRQDALRLAPLLVLTLALDVGWAAVHLTLGVRSDFDSSIVYPREGNAFLHGHYPSTEYPPGAILLFAFEALVSGGSGHGVRAANPFVLAPCQLVCVAAIWLLHTRWSRWTAAVVALWPSNVWYWELKYDLAPTAALAGGLLLAHRRRWVASGVVLGLGAALKWTPGIAAAALVLWLACSGERREAVRHGAAAVAAFLLVNLPFLVWAPRLVVHTYHVQAGRGITGESLQYLVLRALGRGQIPPNSPFYGPIVAPHWATPASSSLQIVCVVLVLGSVLLCRGRLDAAVTVAALAPAVFLLTTRTFSPQYLVTCLVAWAIGAALLGQPVAAALGCVAALANVLVYPTVTPTYWWACSWLLFLAAFAATGVLLVSLRRRRR